MGLSAISYRGMLMGNKGKGKVTVHATMMYGNGGIAPLINRLLGGPHRKDGHFGQGKNLLSLL